MQNNSDWTVVRKKKKTPKTWTKKWALVFIEDFYKTKKSSLKQILVIYWKYRESWMSLGQWPLMWKRATGTIYYRVGILNVMLLLRHSQCPPNQKWIGVMQLVRILLQDSVNWLGKQNYGGAWWLRKIPWNPEKVVIYLATKIISHALYSKKEILSW